MFFDDLCNYSLSIFFCLQASLYSFWHRRSICAHPSCKSCLPLQYPLSVPQFPTHKSPVSVPSSHYQTNVYPTKRNSTHYPCANLWLCLPAANYIYLFVFVFACSGLLNIVLICFLLFDEKLWFIYKGSVKANGKDSYCGDCHHCVGPRMVLVRAGPF